MKKILLLLSEGFEALEASAFTDVFGWDNTIGSKGIELVTASVTTPIKTTWNFEVYTEKLIADIAVDEFDALVIPGGFGKAGFFKQTKEDIFQEIMKEFHLKEKYIAGICTGVIPLAESGILEGKRATTYLLDNERYFMQLKRHKVIPVRESIVVDGKIITSSSPGTAIKVAFLLLELLTDRENCDFIKTNMGF